MRYLHPIAAHEKFIASGTYHYTHGGDETRLVEHWTIHELPDGAWFMRVDKDGRFHDKRSVLIEAWRSPGGTLERYDVVAYGAPGEPIGIMRVTVTVEDGVLYVGRTLNNSTRTNDEIPLPDAYVLHPGGLVFVGAALPGLSAFPPAALVAQGGFADEPDAAFRAVLTDPDASFDGEQTATIDGKSLAARKYTLNNAAYWVDAHDIPLWQESGAWTAQLTRYAHRP